MAQVRQQNSSLRSRYAQPPVMPTATVVSSRTACEQLQQLSRKLEAARAEIRRYQTRLFACERQMIALRKENAELEAACEQAREEAAQAEARAARAEEQLRQAADCVGMAETPEVQVTEPIPADEAPAPEAAEPESQEPMAGQAQTEAPQQAAPAREPTPVEPEWQPQTELEHRAAELMNWFDQMMGA